jgi:hypothetical protein
MGIVVTFSYAAWSNSQANQNIAVSQEQVTDVVLPMAEQFCRNDGSGPVDNAAVALQLLNLMVSHLAVLFYGTVTNPADPTAVGRVSDAAQGSVRVALEMSPVNNALDAWYAQTQFGLTYQQMIRPFTMFRFIPHRSRRAHAVWPGMGWPY